MVTVEAGPYTRLMPTSPQFEKAYAGLNAEQKEAVDTIEGPVMVVAGPGTGKTQILTLRIARILLATDTKPEQVLALTFTESGVRAMRERLREHIGIAAYRVQIHTFHSFANSLITLHPDMFPRIIGGIPLHDVERAHILETCLLEENLQHLRPYGDPLFYLKSVGRAIGDFKREAITPEMLEERVRLERAAFDVLPEKVHMKGAHKGKVKGEYITLEKKLERNSDLVAVYRRYEQEMRSRKRYDFDDMIIEVVRALRESESFRQEVSEQFQYIHADEHQDANGGQNAVLELLATGVDLPNIFVVGDEKQSIFRFQGATLDNFLYFKKIFPEAVLIPLLRNYRSTQPILDAVQSLIDHAPGDETLRIPLTAEAKHATPTPIVYAEADSESDEEWYVAQEVSSLIAGGVSPGDIAVLYRNNADALPIQVALMKKGVRSHIQSDNNSLRDPYVQSLLALLRAVTYMGDDLYLPDVLHIPSLQLPPLDVFKVLRGAARMKISPWKVISESQLLSQCGVTGHLPFGKLFDSLLHWQQLSRRESLPILAERIFRESALLDEILCLTDFGEHLAHVRGFLRTLGTLLERNHSASLVEVMEWIERHEVHGIAVHPEGRTSREHVVSLMTAHRSKGLEYRFVFVTGVTNGEWGNRKRPQYFHLPGILGSDHDLDDERRLLYVALTRAKERVIVTYAKQVDDTDVPRAVFLDEIDERLVTKHTVVHADSLELERERFGGADATTHSDDMKELVRTALADQGLSVTALNNYLSCPWKYFYVNLLRVPQAKEKPMLFGSAIHDALRYFFDAYRKGTDVSTEAVVGYFTESLQHLPLSDREIDELLEKGSVLLPGYLAEYENSFVRDTFPEHALTAEFVLEGEEKPLLLRGTLDRMDILKNGDCVVIDYKTGKPKTRNEIEGKTKNGTGDYKRQLVFYALLLERSLEKRHMDKGILDFVEPDPKGKYHREEFAVTKEEKSALEEIIQQVAEEILALAFWNTNCENKDCEFCRLRQKIKLVT